jgi:hypothetical protein
VKAGTGALQLSSRAPGSPAEFAYSPTVTGDELPAISNETVFKMPLPVAVKVVPMNKKPPMLVEKGESPGKPAPTLE